MPQRIIRILDESFINEAILMIGEQSHYNFKLIKWPYKEKIRLSRRFLLNLLSFLKKVGSQILV